ncbi:MAG: YabP/YqfC family sporulation protein [Oscillospiraceae bacterium]|nr:YabP/YqfC family sporulation protein [Oscillospiraceae bacterium]
MNKLTIKELAMGYEKQKNRLSQQSSLQITQTATECEVVADGCRRVVSCDGNIVVFEQVYNRVTITGDKLKLRNWGTNGVTVSGTVQGIEFGGVK